MAYSTAKFRIVGAEHAAILVSATGTNEIQQAAITGAPTGGSFTLTYGGQTTVNIPYNASGDTVQAALEGLSSIGAGNVTVTGAAGGPFLVTFTGTLSDTDITPMTATATGLTGGTSPAVAITTPTPGSASAGTSINEVDLHFVNSVTWDPQTSEINFEGDNQQVRRTYLNGINVAIRLDTWDLHAVSVVFQKQEITTITGVAGRTYFGDTDEQAGQSCGFLAQVRAENLVSGNNETLKLVSPRGRLQVVRPPVFGYNAKAPQELTYAAERTTQDIAGANLPGVPSGGAFWYADRVIA